MCLQRVTILSQISRVIHPLNVASLTCNCMFGVEPPCSLCRGLAAVLVPRLPMGSLTHSRAIEAQVATAASQKFRHAWNLENTAVTAFQKGFGLLFSRLLHLVRWTALVCTSTTFLQGFTEALVHRARIVKRPKAHFLAVVSDDHNTVMRVPFVVYYRRSVYSTIESPVAA